MLLEGESEEFARRLGFEIEPFGAEGVRVDGVPALAGGLEPGSLVRELWARPPRPAPWASQNPDLRRRLVTSAACQAAIKIHHPLTPPEMQRLIDDLYAAENPTTCPHGRPILFRLTLEELERSFRRR